MLDSECGVLVVVRAASYFPPLLFGVWFFLCATPWTAAHQASLSFLSPRVCSDLCPLSWWCHPTVSSPIVPLSSCLQSFPASGSFPMSWLFASGGQRIGAPASASVLPMNIQGWFPLGNLGEWQQPLPVHECPLTHVQYLMYMQLLQGCTKWMKCKWSLSVF